jgi:hypothetical protein
MMLLGVAKSLIVGAGRGAASASPETSGAGVLVDPELGDAAGLCWTNAGNNNLT